MNRDLISTVIERWRSASMSHRMSDDDFDDYSAPFDAAPPLQPAPPQAPAMPPPVPPSPRGEALRSSLLEEAARCDHVRLRAGRQARLPAAAAAAAAVPLTVIAGRADGAQ